MDREKLLDKIRKCLALGKSSNEHEAAAALRQAQKLMQQAGIEAEEAGAIEYLSVTVVTDYEYPSVVTRSGNRKQIKIPQVVAAIVSLVRHALGVHTVFEHAEKGSQTMISVRYFGPRERVMIAGHAHVVCYRAVKKAWRDHLEEEPWLRSRPGARAGFYIGWCNSVKDKVMALVVPEEEFERIQKFKRTFYGKDLEAAQTSNRGIYGSTLEAGVQAGSEFDMNRPIAQDRLRLDHQK